MNVGVSCQYAQENWTEWVITYCTRTGTMSYSRNSMEKNWTQWAGTYWIGVSEMGYTPNIPTGVVCVTLWWIVVENSVLV
jgi:hypothetical protein